SDPGNWDIPGGPPRTDNDQATIGIGARAFIDQPLVQVEDLTVDDALLEVGSNRLFVEFVLRLGGADGLPSFLTVGVGGEVSAGTLAVSNGGVLDLGNNGRLILGFTDPNPSPSSGAILSGFVRLDNGVIKNGTLIDDPNGGSVAVTTNFAEQIDDQHSVLENVTIIGPALNVGNFDGAVLTFAGTTHVESNDGSNDLVNAVNALLAFRNFGGGNNGESDLGQNINATDTIITSADLVLVIEGAQNGKPAVSIIGTAQIISDYAPSGFFSDDVTLINHG